MQAESPKVPSATGGAIQPRRTTTQALLGPDGQLLIEHRGDCYMLRVTRQGRLILTK